MSIAILSIPLGIISAIVFIWSINKISDKPAKGKKKDNDSTIIGVIVSVILLFVALGIYDGKESTAGLFSSENSAQEQNTRQESTNISAKNDSQREVEESNKSKDDNKSHSEDTKNNSNTDVKEADSTTVAKDSKQNVNLEKQQKAYQQWRAQIESKIQNIDNTWSALWTDSSPDSINKLIKALDTDKLQLEKIKIPEELSEVHRQKLTEASNRYHQWIDSRIQACLMKSSENKEQDITNEIARGDGLKLRSNLEISSIGNELGISN